MGEKSKMLSKIFRRRKTNLKDLKKIVKNVQKFDYRKSYTEVSRIGKVSLEELSSDYEGNCISICWQWAGEFASAEGLKDEYLHTVEGRKKEKFHSGAYFYHNNKSYSSNYIHNSSNRKNGEIIREIASLARIKYLQQTSFNKLERKNIS